MEIGKKMLNWVKAPSGKAMIGGAGVGGYIGSSMGIAAFGTAFSAMLPFALFGAIFGWLGVKAYRSRSAPGQTNLSESKNR